ncbi:MAG: 3-phosphoshikimate 1-carboxyvinyltransferase, partial [Flavobacteriales bacterium]
GLDNLPLKETDRLRAVAEALRTLGCSAAYEGGSFKLEGVITNLRPQPFDPQGDHRMAMSIAPLALVCDQITILHPEVVAKSYPGFWEDLRSAGFSLQFG